MTDKHLLWWVLKAVDATKDYGATRGHILNWLESEAPEWALPALQKLYADLDVLEGG